MRVADPVTGAARCVVAAPDRSGRTSFSQVGRLYPVIESDPVHGVLVGVSSGGRFRVPTGDILWRVDDLPYRELKAADNPATAGAVAAPGSDPGTRMVQDAMAAAMRMAAGLSATSTLASGDKARAMLAEMRAGQGLVFRAAAAAPAHGLPSSATYRVGQITSKGLKPIPLDASLAAALAECGIATELPA